MSDKVVDLTVETRNPQLLDETLQSLPGCTVQVIEGTFDGRTVKVRVFQGLGFLTFSMERQGYGRIVEQEDVS